MAENKKPKMKIGTIVRVLGPHVREYKRPSILTPICMIAEVACETVVPLLMARIINLGVEKSDMGAIWTTGLAMIAVALFGLAAGMLGGKWGAEAATGFAKNLREAMFDKVQTFSFANIDKFSTPSLVTRLTTDVSNIQNAYQMILRMCFRAPVSLISAMTAAFFVNARIASIYLYAVFFLVIVAGLLLSRSMKYFREVFPRYDDLNESVQENVSAIRVVKAYVREDYESDKFRKAAGAIYKLFVKAENSISYGMPVMQFTVYACIILISWFGAKTIVAGGMETGDLASLLAYCMNILMSLMMLTMIFVMLTMSQAAGERIAQVLTEESTLKDPEKPLTEVPDGAIRFDHVDFAYTEGSGDKVLQDITLDIRSGETIGIIGATGSAKTSLVNLISRLYDVTSGSVSVGGHDVRAYDMEVLRNQVSVVLQKNVLFSGTILENLRWGKEDATEEECRRACRLACADEFIEKLPYGYETKLEQGGTNVSGGQRQRLCIARALLKDPKVLILDDSTSAVDTATDAKIRRAFAEEIPDVTKIIIAQRIASVESADRVIVMENGRVAAFDAPERLLETSPIYREVYESQTKGSGDFDERGGEL